MGVESEGFVGICVGFCVVCSSDVSFSRGIRGLFDTSWVY